MSGRTVDPKRVPKEKIIKKNTLQWIVTGHVGKDLESIIKDWGASTKGDGVKKGKKRTWITLFLLEIKNIKRKKKVFYKAQRVSL